METLTVTRETVTQITVNRNIVLSSPNSVLNGLVLTESTVVNSRTSYVSQDGAVVLKVNKVGSLYSWTILISNTPAYTHVTNHTILTEIIKDPFGLYRAVGGGRITVMVKMFNESGKGLLKQAVVTDAIVKI